MVVPIRGICQHLFHLVLRPSTIQILARAVTCLVNWVWWWRTFNSWAPPYVILLSKDCLRILSGTLAPCLAHGTDTDTWRPLREVHGTRDTWAHRRMDIVQRLRNDKKITKLLSKWMSKEALSLIKIEELSIYPITCSTVYRKYVQNA